MQGDVSYVGTSSPNRSSYWRLAPITAVPVIHAAHFGLRGALDGEPKASGAGALGLNGELVFLSNLSKLDSWPINFHLGWIASTLDFHGEGTVGHRNAVAGDAVLAVV